MEMVGFSLSYEETAMLKIIQGNMDLDPDDVDKRPEAIRYCLKLLNEVLSGRYDIQGGLKVECMSFDKKHQGEIKEGDKVILKSGVVHTVIEEKWPYYIVIDPVLDRQFSITISDIRFKVVESFGVWS